MATNFTPIYYPKTAQLPLGGFGAVGAPGPLGSMRGPGASPTTLYENGQAFELEGFPDPLVQQYQVDYSGKSPEQGARDIDLHTVSFGSFSDRPFGVAIANSNKRPPQPPMRIMSLPRINQFLLSSEGRALYSGADGPAKFCQDWRYIGVPMTAITEGVRAKSELAITVCVGKRARVPNIWLCTGNEPKVNQSLWAIVNRCRVKDTAKHSSGSMPMETDEKKTKEKAPLFEDLSSVVHGEETKLPEEFVRLDPFITEGNQRPSSVLEASGAKCIFLGTITETHGKANLAIHKTMASDAVYSMTNSDLYKTKLVGLPHLVMLVNLHT
jgi:hypothetical protein